MNEEVKNEEQEDIVHTIPLKRHLWPEEVELNKAKKKLKRSLESQEAKQQLVYIWTMHT